MRIGRPLRPPWKSVEEHMTLKISILPVYSEQYTGPDQEIGSIHLLKHQVETMAAFNDPNIDVIFNVAMTGDGKSLAAYLPAFQKQKNIIAMYPTNELVQDQHRALPRYEQDLQIRLPRYGTMYSDKITQLMRENDNKAR